MTVVVKDVLRRVRTILQDAGSTRWLLPELSSWLSDAMREIAFYKPTAVSKTIVIELDAGTYQELADGQQIIRAHRNITSAVSVTPRVAGPVITPIVRDILDAQIPNWHATASVPFSAIVRHIVTDIMNPRMFYVFPGNDGTGRIEVTASIAPSEISLPNAGPAADIEDYTEELAISAMYIPTLVDYVLYRAFSKDMQFAGAPERAIAHYNNFQRALGQRQEVENIANVNTTQNQPDS